MKLPFTKPADTDTDTGDTDTGGTKRRTTTGTKPVVDVAMDDWADHLTMHQHAAENARMWKETADGLKEQINHELGNRLGTKTPNDDERHYNITINGHQLATSLQISSTKLDTPALREDHPQLAARYTIPNNYRRLKYTEPD